MSFPRPPRDARAALDRLMATGSDLAAIERRAGVLPWCARPAGLLALSNEAPRGTGRLRPKGVARTRRPFLDGMLDHTHLARLDDEPATQ